MPDIRGAHLVFLTEHFGVKLNFPARQEKVKLHYFCLIFLGVLEQFPLGKILELSSLLITFLLLVSLTETFLGVSSLLVSAFSLIRQLVTTLLQFQVTFGLYAWSVLEPCQISLMDLATNFLLRYFIKGPMQPQ